MPILGRKRPNLASAEAHIAIEEADWVPAPITYAGSGTLVPAELLPVQRLIEPLELVAGGYFVPDVEGSVHGNDTPGRANGRKADAIEIGEIKRDMSAPPHGQGQGQAAQSGIVERPGAQKAKAG
jgi:hypothetical protein